MPTTLERFRLMVKERGSHLRTKSFEDLRQLGHEPTENIAINSRPATISIIVQPCEDGSVRVVIQGFIKSRFLPWKDVAIDGFYKHPDGTVTQMSSEEFYDYD